MKSTNRTRARPWLRPKEAAAILGIEQDSVRHQLGRGRLKGIKFGRRWRIRRLAVAGALATSLRWRKAAAGGTMLSSYATPSGGVATLWRCGAAFHTVQRFTDGTMERFDLADAEAARLHYEYAQMVGVVAGSFPKPLPVATTPDGKRHCSFPGCDAILSRFNDGERCALHA